MQKLILNYTLLHETPTSCERTRIYIGDMRTEEVNECAVYIQLLNESFSVKTENSNVMLTLRGFRWYPYFVAPE